MKFSFSQWKWIELKSRYLRVLLGKRCWTWTQFVVLFEMTMMYLKLNCSINHKNFWDHRNPRITEEHQVNLHDVLFIIKGINCPLVWFIFKITMTGPVYLKSLQQSVMPRIPEDGKYCFQLGGILSLYHRLIWWYLCQREGLNKEIQWNIRSVSTLHINKFSF